MTTKREYPDFYWLTPESREFLQRGYLLEGVTAEQRVREIAEHAEHRLGIEGFADKFYKYMSKGWFSLSTPIWNNYGNSRGMSISCVVGDTWINTDKGGKMAKDIEIGDMVLTHKNRYRPVTNIIPTKMKGDIYKLKVQTRMTNLYITGNHPVLTNLGWVKVEDLDPNVHLVAVNGNVDYEEKPHTIDMKEYITYPFIIEDGLIKKKKENKERPNGRPFDKSPTHVTFYSQPPEYVEVDRDLAWAFGLWFAEGSLSINKEKKPNGIRITLNKRDEKLAHKWLSIVCSKFNLHGNIYESRVYRNDKWNEWISVNVHGKAIGNLFDSFGRGCKNKTMPDWMLTLPRPILYKVWLGLLQGDGSIRNNINKLTLSNPKLLLQMYKIGLHFDVDMSLQMQEKPRELGTTPHVYTLIVRNVERDKIQRRVYTSGIKFNDGLTYCKIVTLEKTNRVEDVWDFTVDEDHSFSCAGVVVHNCFSSFCDDSIEGITDAIAEISMMSKFGGGTSVYMGNVRPRGSAIKNNGKSNGSFSFLPWFESTINCVAQGLSRRGQCAAYIDIDHADIEEWLDIHTEGNPIQTMYYGVCVGNDWLEEMKAGDKRKRAIWAKVIQRRTETGIPYLFFKDNANNNKPEIYKDKNLNITNSNLCAEISLPISKEESFVCCLSSMNLLHYDEWKDTDAVKVLTYFLDSVMSEFIEDTRGVKYMERAHRFSERHRALGIGVLGWHSYLQANMIPFESFQAMQKNAEIFKYIKEQTYEASAELAQRYGEPEILKGYGRRNTTLMAVAPTKSSSFILGQVSPSIEPLKSNYFVKDLAKLKSVYKNPYLVELLQAKGKDTDDVWDDILSHDGSVQHLAFLTQEEKDVFKTFSELSQMTVIQQAAQRQAFIDQGQSINIMVHPSTPAKDINQLYLTAAEMGVKSLYYQLSMSAAQVFNRNLLNTCVSCEA